MNDQNTFSCPSCGQTNTFYLDADEGDVQQWITDCEVCCRPVVVSIELRNGRIARLDTRGENE
jgi:hypothetical protein